METNSNTFPRHHGRRSRRNSRQGSRNSSRNSSLNRSNHNLSWKHLPNDEHFKDFGRVQQTYNNSRRPSLSNGNSNGDIEMRQINGIINGNSSRDNGVDTDLDYSSSFSCKANQRQGNKKNKKMKDINRKGVEKEGTEMDAFTESNQEEKEKPVAPATINNPPALSNKTPLVEKISNKDELEEKIVAAKNEENSKVSALSKTEEDDSPAPIIEKSQPPPVSLKHKYKDDQWSPINPCGKKKYEREFLLDLQNEPQSMKKPENLPNIEVVIQDHTSRRIGAPPINYSGSNRGGNDFIPAFIRSGGSLSRGQTTNRKSQQSSKGGKGKVPGIMHISLSLKDDVKLRETENAWKPARFTNTKENTEEDRKTEDLYKKVRSILNKLTPQKFDTLVNQVKALPVDTVPRLQGVINLVFDKAVDEPGFASAYANMCKLVANMEVKVDKDDHANSGSSKSVVFRKVLLNRCQTEFERNKVAELDSERRLKEINACTDPEKKKELQLNYEEEERKIRRKSVGNVRFIGELFKLDMLTAPIMHRCMQDLLKKHEEEPLECLCKLLTTIGKELEVATANVNQKDKLLPDLDYYFNQMRELSQKKDNSKISSRVRFMLQDVIELRQHKWIPRRDDNKPKTIDQIQRDADRESMEMSLALSAPRKQDMRVGDSDRKGRNRGNMNQNEDKEGWQSVGSGKSFRTSYTYSFEPSRMQAFKQTQQSEMISLGSSSQFNSWSRGANTKSTDNKSGDRAITVNNMYSPLSKSEKDSDKKHSNIAGSRSAKITPSPSIEKERMMAGVKTMDADRQSHRVQQSSQPPSRDRTPTPARVNAATPSVTTVPTQQSLPLTPEEIERKAQLIVDEFLCNKNLEEAQQSIEEFGRNVDEVLLQMLICTGNKKSPSHALIGKLFSDLIKNNFLMQSVVVNLYEKLVELYFTDDWIIDIPLIWTYVAELIAPPVKSEKFSFADIQKINKPIMRESKGFFVPLLNLLSQECGEGWVRKKWAASRLKLTDFVPDPNNHKELDFLSRETDSTQTPPASLSMDEVQKKLTKFLNDDMSFDNICQWISENVAKNLHQQPQFIRALTTAICDASVFSKRGMLVEMAFKKNENLIRRFVDSEPELEVQCLFAIQAFTTRLQHPSGLLLNIFNCLWEDNVISNDAFTNWRDSDSLEEGKGVAVKSLTTFFTMLNESELSDEAS